jgi:hypothetical protein
MCISSAKFHHRETTQNMQSRREFLRVSAVTTAATFSGCLDGIAGKVSSGVAWPPPRPLSVPDLDNIPDIPPPTWGKSDVPQVFIYNDMATREAGRVFHREWGGLTQPIKENRIQVSFCDYPLPSNEWSYPIAIAARSVQHHAGKDAFLKFAQRVLRDFVPRPYLTKQRVLDAVETAGAPREAVKEDTEAWRFYPIVKQSRRRGKKRGINNSVSRSVIVYNGERSRPLLTSWETIPSVADEMFKSETS